MMENRSFDHIMGFLKRNNTKVDGCLPNQPGCSNPLDPTDPNSQTFTVNDQAQEHQVSDPDHSNEGTTKQIYGFGPTDVPVPPMSGFIKDYSHQEVIMECFPPELVPASTTLASEFALFNRWYSSVPGPTEVNRLYLMTATSDGSANNDDARLAIGYPQRSVFENLDESIYNRTWGVYFQDGPSAFFVKYTRSQPHNFHDLEQFYQDSAAGTLPSFTFLEPRYADALQPATDQHPDHDVGLGDQLMKSVYESLVQSPLWNKTLLLITYDEHGGFFDHIPPPTDCPNPDGKDSHDSTPSFDFTRLGVRVPAIAISPWIAKGVIIDEPVNGTHYEHSSVIATIRALLCPDQPFLTKRDAWAQPFDWLVDTVSTEPRTDYPKTLPTAPTQRNFGILPPLDQIGNGPATSLQKTFIKVASALNTGEITQTGDDMTEKQGGLYMAEKYNEFLLSERLKLDM
eukprot:TRINITY_DN5155_c0_g1_i9.p1 TRINITY_DN5155_c0_g1~~TRINITY_DN5155_c0_g1_i9.p1  ORF type:complete len:456 (+),score=63.71 TRINITY_DN5155_c0_g1_i9:104-1471(+)